MQLRCWAVFTYAMELVKIAEGMEHFEEWLTS